MDADVQPYDLPVTITIGETALKAIATANHQNTWQLTCMANTIGRIIQNALASELADQLDHNNFAEYDIARAITVTVDDGELLVERANQVAGPFVRDYDVDLEFQRYTLTVSAESRDDAKDYAYNMWRELVETVGLELDRIANVEPTPED